MLSGYVPSIHRDRALYTCTSHVGFTQGINECSRTQVVKCVCITLLFACLLTHGRMPEHLHEEIHSTTFPFRWQIGDIAHLPLLNRCRFLWNGAILKWCDMAPQGSSDFPRQAFHSTLPALPSRRSLTFGEQIANLSTKPSSISITCR